jgi:hypothetical protein
VNAIKNSIDAQEIPRKIANCGKKVSDFVPNIQADTTYTKHNTGSQCRPSIFEFFPN